MSSSRRSLTGQTAGRATTAPSWAYRAAWNALVVVRNDDRPGMIGAYGTILGKHQVNIANMSLSRNEEGGTALTLLSLDSTPSPEVIQELEKIEGVKRIHCMALDS